MFVWFDLLYDVVKTEQSSPPVASRIYGIAAVALYEAIVPGSLENRSLVGQLNALSPVPSQNPNGSARTDLDPIDNPMTPMRISSSPFMRRSKVARRHAGA